MTWCRNKCTWGRCSSLYCLCDKREKETDSKTWEILYRHVQAFSGFGQCGESFWTESTDAPTNVMAQYQNIIHRKYTTLEMTVGAYCTTAKHLRTFYMCSGIFLLEEAVAWALQSTVKDTEQGCNTVISYITLNEHILVFCNGKQICRQNTH